jgi:hypothetical protein
MKIAPIIDPSVRKPSPKPVRVDLRKVFMFGTALWAIALVVCIVLIAFGIDAERAQTVCEVRSSACSCWFGSISTVGIIAVLASNRQYTPEKSSKNMMPVLPLNCAPFVGHC